MKTIGRRWALHRSIEPLESKGEIHGISICRGAPSVSHLLFADDSFLFCKATNTAYSYLRHIFHLYELASGQNINLDKSCVSFSSNMDITAQSTLANLLGVHRVDAHDHYLGLPTSVGRLKKRLVLSLSRIEFGKRPKVGKRNYLVMLVRRSCQKLLPKLFLLIL